MCVECVYCCSHHDVAFLTPSLFPSATRPCAHQVTWTKLTRGNPDHAWVAKVPTWPLTLVFLAQFLAIAGAVCEYCTAVSNLCLQGLK